MDFSHFPPSFPPKIRKNTGVFHITNRIFPSGFSHTTFVCSAARRRRSGKIPPYNRYIPRYRQQNCRRKRPMIKGINRQMIEVTHTGSPYFERAFLVVRAGCSQPAEEALQSMAEKVVQQADLQLHRYISNL